MHYLRFVIDDRVTPGPADEPGAVDAFNYQLKTDGSWVFAGSLTSPNDATVADNRSGDVVFTDGPFVEPKEYLAGLWFIEAPDLDVVLVAGGSKPSSQACLPSVRWSWAGRVFGGAVT